MRSFSLPKQRPCESRHCAFSALHIGEGTTAPVVGLSDKQEHRGVFANSFPHLKQNIKQCVELAKPVVMLAR